MTMTDRPKLTTESGAPVPDNQHSQTAGPGGPVLVQDMHLLEKLTRFNRERIPERVVHARGSGAHGHFEVTQDVAPFTRARFLSEVGKRTEVFARFSTVAGSRGSADAVRDPRGFALKFYTEDGNYDLTGNDTPIFFIRDPLKFPDFIHSQKPDPRTNRQEPDNVWDFFSLSSEATHMFTWLFGDRGIPASYRHMDGFGSHTYQWVNAAAVVIGPHETVAAVVGGHGGVRAVDGQLRVVDAEAVAVRVAIGEQAPLQHLVGRRPDAGHDVGGVERRLLHVGEVVVGVAVEHQLADLAERMLGVRPYLGHVEGVEAVRLGVVLGHDLDPERPARVLAAVDRLEQVELVRVGRLADDLGRLLPRQEPDPLVGLEVVLDPDALAGGVDPLIGVRAEAVHVPVARRDAAIAEQPGEHVRGLGRKAEAVPDVVWLLAVGARVGLLRVDEVGELERVADEEDRRVVAGQVVVAVFGVELEGEPAGVADCVSGAAAASHRAEAREHFGALADLAEEARPREGRHVLGHFEVAVGARAAGMHDPLGDALAVEARQFLEQVHVLDEHRSAGPGGLRVLVVGDGSPGLGGELGTVGHRHLLQVRGRRSSMEPQ